MDQPKIKNYIIGIIIIIIFLGAIILFKKDFRDGSGFFISNNKTKTLNSENESESKKYILENKQELENEQEIEKNINTAKKEINSSPEKIKPMVILNRKQGHSWWIYAQIMPAEKVIRGININTIDKSWKYASELNLDIFEGIITESEMKELKLSDAKFSQFADVNKNGIKEEFFVGVYETGDGKIGRFIAIIENSKLIRHFSEALEENFGILYLGSENKILWSSCLECDAFWYIYWDGKSYGLDFNNLN